MLLNIADNGIGDKRNGLAGGQLGPDVARSDIVELAGAYIGQKGFGPGGRQMKCGGIGGEAGAGEGDDSHRSEQFQWLVPSMQLVQGVGADNKNKFGLWMTRLQGAQGVQCVRGAWPFELDRENRKAGLVLDREFEHGEAVGVGGEAIRGFVGRDGTGDKPHGGQIEQAQGVARNAQVAIVNGVEGAAQDPDGAGRRGGRERRWTALEQNRLVDGIGGEWHDLADHHDGHVALFYPVFTTADRNIFSNIAAEFDGVAMHMTHHFQNIAVVGQQSVAGRRSGKEGGCAQLAFHLDRFALLGGLYQLQIFHEIRVYRDLDVGRALGGDRGGRSGNRGWCAMNWSPG